MIIYRTFSFIQFIFSVLLRAAYILVAAIALYHYSENPVVTSVIALICVFFFLLTGRDSLIVYADSVEISSGSILWLLRRRKVFQIADIKSMNTEGIFKTGDELYNPTLKGDKPLNKIEIELKNGSRVKIQTSIYMDQLKKAESAVNQLLR